MKGLLGGMLILCTLACMGCASALANTNTDDVARQRTAVAILAYESGTPADSVAPDTPISGRHARANCPTGGWILQDGKPTGRCPLCDPPYTAGEAPPAPLPAEKPTSIDERIAVHPLGLTRTEPLTTNCVMLSLSPATTEIGFREVPPIPLRLDHDPAAQLKTTLPPAPANDAKQTLVQCSSGSCSQGGYSGRSFGYGSSGRFRLFGGRFGLRRPFGGLFASRWSN